MVILDRGKLLWATLYVCTEVGALITGRQVRMITVTLDWR